MGASVRRSHCYPRTQGGNLLVGQLSLWRHLEILGVVAHRLHQQALVRRPRNYRRPRFTALQQPFPRVEHKIGFDFIRLVAVAFVAILREDWQYLPLEELQLARRELSRGRGTISSIKENWRTQKQCVCSKALACGL